MKLYTGAIFTFGIDSKLCDGYHPEKYEKCDLLFPSRVFGVRGPYKRGISPGGDPIHSIANISTRIYCLDWFTGIH